jgi:hypothetical protein
MAGDASNAKPPAHPATASRRVNNMAFSRFALFLQAL